MPAGRPTIQTKQIIAKIAEAISFGLTNDEAAAVAGIDDITFVRWNRKPEFRRSIKNATSRRLLSRLKRIDRGEEGWQGIAWSLERQFPARFAKPEIQLSISNNYTQNNLSINISGTEAKEIEAIAEPVRDKVKEMFTKYKPQLKNGNGNGNEAQS